MRGFGVPIGLVAVLVIERADLKYRAIQPGLVDEVHILILTTHGETRGGRLLANPSLAEWPRSANAAPVGGPR